MPWAAAQELHCAASGRGAGVSPGSNEQGDHGRSEGEMRVDAACTGHAGRHEECCRSCPRFTGTQQVLRRVATPCTRVGSLNAAGPGSRLTPRDRGVGGHSLVGMLFQGLQLPVLLQRRRLRSGRVLVGAPA